MDGKLNVGDGFRLDGEGGLTVGEDLVGRDGLLAWWFGVSVG